MKGHFGRAVIFSGVYEDLQFVNHPLPLPEEGEVLVKILMSTICKSDVNTYFGKRTEPTPLVLGHEMIGTIDRLPDKPIPDLNGRPLQLGDLVTWSIFANPVEDELSTNGMPQKSPYKIKYGHETLSEDHFFSGGFSTHCHLLRGTSIIQLSPKISLKTFCPVNCSLSTIVAAVRTAGDVTGKFILVTGGGMLGLHTIAYLHYMDAGQIHVLESDERRRGLCAAFKANKVFDSVNGITDKYDIIIDTSGSYKVMENGIYLLKTGGTAVWIGGVFPQNTVALDSEYLIRNLLTIKGMHNYNRTDFKNAVDFMLAAQHEFPFDQLVEHSFPLEKLDEAMHYTMDQKPYRVAIVCE